jgi:hypothetical protein
VQNELCDVVITAMVALARINPEARDVFRRHLDAVAVRSLGAGADAGAGPGGQADGGVRADGPA